jgi:hypothetical protein
MVFHSRVISMNTNAFAVRLRFDWKTAFEAAAVFLSATATHAAVILSTDFDGRSVSGATASNITYVIDGVQKPGNWTAVPNDAGSVSLFNTTDATNRFAVADNPANWTVTLPIILAAGVDSIVLDDIVLTVESFTNSGASKAGTDTATANYVTVELWNETTSTQIVQQQLGQATGPLRSLWTGTSTDFDGIALAAGSDYSIRLNTAGSVSGNNTGFREFTVNGVVPVPEPAGLVAAGWSP